MLRSWYFLVPVFLFSCKSLPDQRRASVQFMQLATESKTTLLTASMDNTRLSQVIARVESDQSCTGVLVGMPMMDESPAYLLTAGHCLIDFDDVASSNRIFRDALPRSDRNSIYFPTADFRVGRVVYATMKGIDLAIAEITEEDSTTDIFHLTERRDLEPDEARLPKPVTLRRLKELGMEPLPFARNLPAIGDGIRIVSAVPDDEGGTQFLQEHRCHHEGFANVVESIWHWYDLARNNCIDILPGSSGAPILTAQSTLFAIVNTSSRSALSQHCYMGQPCEMTEDNFQVAPARNYGSVVLGLPGCFDAQGSFQVDDPRCPLEHSALWQVTRQVKTPVNPHLQKPEERRWNVLLRKSASSSAGYRFKTGRVPQTDCRQAANYSDRLDWSDQSLRDLPLPTVSGLYALCLISDEEFRRDDLRYPAVVIVNIDEEPPQLKPRLVINPQTKEPLMSVRKSCQKLPAGSTLAARKKCAVAVISFEFQPYEIVDFYHGWIGAKEQDCRRIKEEAQGPHAHIPVADLPARLCVWAVDGAGNRAQEPSLFTIRAATRREIIEATDVLVDWSFVEP